MRDLKGAIDSIVYLDWYFGKYEDEGGADKEAVKAYEDLRRYVFSSLPSENPEPRLLTWEEIEYDKVYWMDKAGVSHPWPVAFPEEQDDPYKMEDYYGETYEIANIVKLYRIWSDKPNMRERKILWNV